MAGGIGLGSLLAGGLAFLTYGAGAVIGGAGIFGTTIGATGMIGALMSVGIISATPVYVSLVVAALIVALSVFGAVWLLRVRRLIKKVRKAGEGEEIVFTPREARIAEWIIRQFYRRGKPA